MINEGELMYTTNRRVKSDVWCKMRIRLLHTEKQREETGEVIIRNIFSEIGIQLISRSSLVNNSSGAAQLQTH